MSPTLQFRHSQLVSQYALLDGLLNENQDKQVSVLNLSSEDMINVKEFLSARKKLGKKQVHAQVIKADKLTDLPRELQKPWQELYPKLQAFVSWQQDMLNSLSKKLKQRWIELTIPWDKISVLFSQAKPYSTYTVFITANQRPKNGVGIHVECAPQNIILKPKLVDEQKIVDADLSIILHEILHSLELQKRLVYKKQFNEAIKKHRLTIKNNELLYGLCIESTLSCLAPHGILSQEINIETKERKKKN